MLPGPSAKSNKFKTAPGVALQDRLLRADERVSKYDNKIDCKYKIAIQRGKQKCTG